MIPFELIHAHFFFVDIVGLSNPQIAVKKQVKKIEALNSLVSSCKVFKHTDKNSMLVLPTGDGMAIGFLQGPELPVKLAIDLHKKLKAYSKGKAPEETLRVRIGINDGKVYVVKDIQGNENIWGPGIILARRVMDIGDDGHILLAEQTAETLRDLSDKYKQLIKLLGYYEMKHGQKLKIYSLYGNGVGNPKIPKDIIVKPTTIYTKIDLTITITDPKSMLTHHKRIYNVENLSDEPLYTVLHGIATDLPKSFADLNIRTYDESEKELKITGINLDKPYQKEFTTSFDKPILKGEKNRSYVLEYDVEEPKRYFENYFSIDCKKFVMSLIYPSKAGFKPVVYEVKVEEETKKKSKTQPTIEDIGDNLLKATWTRTNILESQAFRLEW